MMMMMIFLKAAPKGRHVKARHGSAGKSREKGTESRRDGTDFSPQTKAND
jgi:hypothetical protein